MCAVMLVDLPEKCTIHKYISKTVVSFECNRRAHLSAKVGLKFQHVQMSQAIRTKSRAVPRPS